MIVALLISNTNKKRLDYCIYFFEDFLLSKTKVINFIDDNVKCGRGIFRQEAGTF